MHKTVLVSDMDGTLLNSKSKVSAENIKSLNEFVKNGGKFTVATGRMKNAVRPYLKDLPINIPAILFNGAMIYDFKNEKILWECFLPVETKDYIKLLLDEFPEIGIQTYHNDDIYFIRENEELIELRKREDFIPHFIPLEKIPAPWLKIILAWKPEKLVYVEEWLKKRKLPFRYTYSEPQFIELLNNEASKGTALNELIKITGLKHKHVITLGDNLNDLEMIEVAGTGIAVDNAHPEIKKIADACIIHHDKHALSHVIKWIREGKKTSLKKCN